MFVFVLLSGADGRISLGPNSASADNHGVGLPVVVIMTYSTLFDHIDTARNRHDMAVAALITSPHD